jgi:hypothetical protein
MYYYRLQINWVFLTKKNQDSQLQEHESVGYRRSEDRTQRVPVMVRNAWNHWVPTLCESSGNVNNLNTQRSGNWICLRVQVMSETPTVLGPLQTLDRNRPTFLNIGLYMYLKFKTMSKVHKPRISVSGAAFVYITDCL